MEDSNFVSTLRKNYQDFRNIYIQKEPFLDDIPWRRHHNPCGSTQGASSLVPTCSEVCMGSNIWEAGHSRRIGILQKRIETALDATEMLLRQKPKEPDGKEELERRHTRSVEFISRFSRNYLFQLRMQAMELKRQLQHMSLTSPGKHSQHQLLLKKLVATHQTAVQGLQISGSCDKVLPGTSIAFLTDLKACLNQLPGSCFDPAILGKLDELLCYICELSSLKNHIDMNTFSIGSEDSPRQDNIKTKAENLIVIVRRKKKESEAAYQAWKETASSLAKKRFGLPSTTKAKIITRSNTQQEKRKLNKAERRVRKQRPGKNIRNSTIRTTLQGGDCELLSTHLNSFDQREHKIDVESDGPLDPATALELKIIMSRMKDILRGAHSKPSPSPKPTYPPNVGLVFITHEEVSPNAEEPREETDDKEDCRQTVQTQEENHYNKQTNTEELLPSTRSTHSQEALRSDMSPDSAEETRLPVSSTRPRRKLTPEEQRIIMYRNRFRAYKKRVRDIQNTSEQLLSTVFREVASELEPSILLDKMYYLELQG